MGFGPNIAPLSAQDRFQHFELWTLLPSPSPHWTGTACLFFFLKSILHFIYLVHVPMCVGVTQCAYGGQETALDRRFSSSVWWILRIDLRLLGSAVSSFAPPPPCWPLAHPFINTLYQTLLQPGSAVPIGVIPDGTAEQMRRPSSAGGGETRGGCQVAMGGGSSNQGSGVCERNSSTFGTASIPVFWPFLFSLCPSRMSSFP